MSQMPYDYRLMAPQGWLCPRCNTVNAPITPYCYRCAPPGTQMAKDTTDQLRAAERAEVEALRADAERWRMFLSTRPHETHEAICSAIDAARTAKGRP